MPWSALRATPSEARLTYLFLVAGVGARQATQHEPPRHEAQIGVGLARADGLLVELREVMALGRCGAAAAGGYLDAGQVEGKSAEGNNLAAFLRLAFFLIEAPASDRGTRRESRPAHVPVPPPRPRHGHRDG